MSILKNRKRLLLIILVALIGVNLWPKGKEATVENEASTIVSSPEDLLNINQEVYSFKVEGFNKNRKVQWGLEGKSANLVGDKINIEYLRAVYNGDDATFNVSADKAVYDKNTSDIELKENVIGKSSDGGELFTDYAKWNSETEDITTDSIVTVKRENLTCRGKGLITKPELEWVMFTKDIVVDFGESKNITCDGPFEVDHKKSIAIFNNNVKVEDKKSVMFTDKLTVFLDPKTNEVKSIVTEGNVEVIHRGSLEDMDDLGKVSF